MTRVELLRGMLLGKTTTSTEGRAPLFPVAKRHYLLYMLEGEDNPDERTLARIEGALWAMGNYAFADMEV